MERLISFTCQIGQTLKSRRYAMDIIFDAIMAFSDVIKNWHERLVPCTSQIRRAAEMPLEVKNWFLENSKTLLGQINPKYIEKSEPILVLVRRGKNDRFHVPASTREESSRLAKPLSLMKPRVPPNSGTRCFSRRFCTKSKAKNSIRRTGCKKRARNQERNL